MIKLYFILKIYLLLIFINDVIALSSGSPNVTQHAEDSCGKYLWRCDNGKCIDELRKCDNFDDCGDTSDEKSCAHLYCNSEHTHYQCKSTECIVREMVCDGAVDCFSEDDEEHCDHDEECPKTKHSCANGRCIPSSWKCDGVRDCRDGSDEKNCSNACHEGYAPCGNGECIPNKFFCDGKLDCDDHYDESNCENEDSVCLTSHGLYRCLDKSKCLEKQWVCDKKAQCNDGSDEGAKCSLSCNRQPPCSQECFATPSGPKCSCRPGYKLLSDEITCEDINECESSIQVCDHYCKNTIGSFSCSCTQNYHLLEDDHSSCRTKDPATMLFSVGNDIVAKIMDGSTSWIVSSSVTSEKPSAIAFDPILENVYWIANRENIYFKHLKSETKTKVFLYQGLTRPENLAVDWFGRNIYITDYEKYHILVCNIETGDCLVVLKNLSQPRALQLDLQERYLYFTAMVSQTIERAGLDGSDRRIFVKEDIVWPNGLALDIPAKRIFWVDAKMDKIDSCNYEGNDRKSFPNKDSSHAYSLAVWQDRIYWTEWQKELQTEIHSCRKRDGRFWKSEYKDEERAVSNIMIYHPSMFENVQNPCDSRLEPKCSHICLLSPLNMEGYVCTCPEDMKLDASGHECLGTGIIPLVAIQSNIYSVPMRNYGTSNMKLQTYAKLHHGMAADMDYNPLKDEIYFADLKKEAVSVVSMLNGKVRTIIGNVKFPISVAIDWLRDNLYWINRVHHTVEVVRTSGSFRRTIITHLQIPTDLAVDVINGYLYVSDASSISSISKCELNGTNCKIIAQAGISKATSLCVDFSTNPRKIYWTDSEKNKIDSVDEYGKNRKTHFIGLNHPGKVYVDNKYIIWTERNSLLVFYASKNNEETPRSTRMDIDETPTSSWLMSLAVINKNQDKIVNPCLGSERKCHHFCFSKTENDMTCGCSQGLILQADGATCSAEKCDSNHEMCENGECIPSLLWCDGSSDCTDKTDEKNCSLIANCSENKFQCDNGLCLDIEYKCDGFSDCPDDSDEANCTVKKCVHADAWRCDSGECLPHAWRCDHTVHCKDGSDEKNCHENVCKDNQKKCDNGWCIPNKWWCDGQEDCKTGEDERQCPCKLGQYKCKDGHCIDEAKICSGKETCTDEKINLACPKLENKQYEGCPLNFIPCNKTSANLICIPFQGWCNRTTECPNNEDEKNCHCQDDQVKCREEDICISRKWVCDGEKDCYQGSDEDGCSPVEYTNSTKSEVANTGCSPHEFQCSDGSCISSEKVCDRNDDCPDGIDESGVCDKCETKNGGCQHECHGDPIKVWCSCKDGFKLSQDHFSCEDINECAMEEACQQHCVNVKGSYYCKCEQGYTLKEDGISCKPTNDEHWSLAVIVDKKLNYLDEQFRNHGSPQELPDYFGKNSKYFYDPIRKMFFGVDGENGILYKESSDKWTKELSSLNNIQAISFDYINRNIYIVMANLVHRKLSRESRIESKIIGSTIQIYNLEKRYIGELVTVPDKNISSLELSLMYRDMITCENDDSGGNIISRYLDGSNTNSLVDEKIKECSGLAIDEFKKRIYWTDSILNRIESVDFLGYDRKRFLSKQIRGPTSLSLLNHNLVWLNTKESAIVKCSIKYPNECREEFLSRGNEIAIINTEKIYDPLMQSPCNSTVCAHICVPHLLDVPHCTCAIGYKPDEGNCTKIRNLEIGELIGSCVINPCKFGDCEQMASGYIQCRCHEGYEGSLCAFASASKKEKSPKSNLLIGFIISFIVIGLIILLFFFFRKKLCSLFSKEKVAKLRFIRPSFVLIEEDSLSQPPTPPIRRNINAAQKRSSQNSNDSTIAIDL